MSQIPGVSLVEVCAVASVFFHVIVVPFVTVSVLGLKDNPGMVTVFAAGGGGGGAPSEVVPESFLQPGDPERALINAMNPNAISVFFMANPRSIIDYCAGHILPTPIHRY